MLFRLPRPPVSRLNIGSTVTELPNSPMVTRDKQKSKTSDASSQSNYFHFNDLWQTLYVCVVKVVGPDLLFPNSCSPVENADCTTMISSICQRRTD